MDPIVYAVRIPEVRGAVQTMWHKWFKRDLDEWSRTRGGFRMRSISAARARSMGLSTTRYRSWHGHSQLTRVNTVNSHFMVNLSQFPRRHDNQQQVNLNGATVDGMVINVVEDDCMGAQNVPRRTRTLQPLRRTKDKASFFARSRKRFNVTSSPAARALISSPAAGEQKTRTTWNFNCRNKSKRLRPPGVKINNDYFEPETTESSSLRSNKHQVVVQNQHVLAGNGPNRSSMGVDVDVHAKGSSSVPRFFHVASESSFLSPTRIISNKSDVGKQGSLETFV